MQPVRRGSLVLLALLALLASSALAQVPDKWTDVERVVAVGDVHGDFAQFVRALRAAKVIDKDENWAAGKTHLVQTGDVLDRAPDSRKAMDLLMKLEKQAAAAGGAVHALLGNHEVMVLRGDYRYLTPGEIESFGGEEKLAETFGPNGAYGRWIRTHNTVIQIDDTLFVHGGLSSAYAKKSLDDINDTVRKELAGDAGEDQISGDAAGPLWYRGLALGDEAQAARDFDAVAKAYGARRIVVGHTVFTKGIKPRLGGKIIMIDVGMTARYGGPAGCLVLEKGTPYTVYAGKEKQKLDVNAADPDAP